MSLPTEADRSRALLDFAREHPVFSVEMAAAHLRCTLRTTWTLLVTLVEAGKLHSRAQQGDAPSVFFRARAGRGPSLNVGTSRKRGI